MNHVGGCVGTTDTCSSAGIDFAECGLSSTQLSGGDGAAMHKQTRNRTLYVVDIDDRTIFGHDPTVVP